MKYCLYIENEDGLAGFYIQLDSDGKIAVSVHPRDCTTFKFLSKATTRAAELMRENWEVTIMAVI